jgi:peptidoglycan/xylan/chitin deacetylase (PgdA/CDA1 family)
MQESKKPGYFVVSLDFELFWGMFDKVSLAEYGDRILGERTAIPRMLNTFTKYGIHATWAGVGMLMARNKRELLSLLPPVHLRPTYENMNVSAYFHIENTEIGEDEKTDPYHFGPTLVKSILETPNQEFGNHTFSHYYAIDGHENDISIFARDLEAHNAIAQTYGIEAESIIFPRNQASEETLRVCREKGIRTYRGNENHILYRPRKDSEQSYLVRAFRLLDHYVNLSGYHTYPLPRSLPGLPVNVPSSRFLRPWSRALSFFEPLRMRRIKNAMTHSAKKGEVFHLWWHPHNFGIDQEQNFRNLKTILEHFAYLKEKYGMESRSMGEIARVASESTHTNQANKIS